MKNLIFSVKKKILKFSSVIETKKVDPEKASLIMYEKVPENQIN